MAARRLSVSGACLVVVLTDPVHCHGSDESTLRSREPKSDTTLSRPSPKEVGPVRIEAIDDAAATPTFVMRGGPRGPGRLVFLHGMCSHGLGYAQSFQSSAARIGTLVAPQGDVPCPEKPLAKWSRDIDGLDTRIVGAYRALGEAGLIDDIAVIGYSQGASRAEALARRFPERYTRLVLIGAPEVPNPKGLSGVRAAVMMAGERDNQELMQEGAATFRGAGIRTIFQSIPDARHGEMGPEPEETMGRALEWLWDT
jgi:pimeloyl-ACP methyl ester carboxylesterase